jgi:hypothetical protein
MKEAMEMCPRFSKCSANKCPLDSDMDLRVELKGEEKCGMEKNVRLRIGRECGLPKLGLTNAEFSAHQKWQGRTEEEKNEIRKQMTKVRASMPSQNPL